MVDGGAQTAGVLDVVLVGSGVGARAWLEPLRRSRRLRLVGTVARGDAVASDVPLYGDLEAAIDAFPGASFALALPPRATLRGALTLARAGVSGVVGAPLHDSLVDVELPAGASAVRVAHGWTTLPGAALVDKVLARGGAGRVSIDLAGLPETELGEIDEVLVHGLALVRSLLTEVAVTAAALVPGGLSVELVSAAASSEWKVELRVRRRGARLSVRVESASDPLVWSCENGRESVALGDRTVVAARAVPNAAQRALAQLLDAPRGDDLRDATAVLDLTRRTVALLPAGLPAGGRMLSRSAVIAQRRPHDLAARLGLCGDVAGTAGDPAPAVLDLAQPPEPFELWAFRAGLKPVAFLTVTAGEVERTLDYFGDVYCERRERLVSVGAQDRWTDQRDRGEPRVELFISRDAAAARRAAHLQAEVDPSRAVRELGELVGYPACCVEAFAAQDDRANNSLNRYHSWRRTIALLPPATPWPWQLNNLHTLIAPFYPCTYRCEQALIWARAALDEMAAVHPAALDRLRAALAMPVLYFDHDHQLLLDGECDGDRIGYRRVVLLHDASDDLVGMAARIGAGDSLVLDDEALLVTRSGQPVLRLERTDPGLGFAAPFGCP